MHSIQKTFALNEFHTFAFLKLIIVMTGFSFLQLSLQHLLIVLPQRLIIVCVLLERQFFLPSFHSQIVIVFLILAFIPFAVSFVRAVKFLLRSGFLLLEGNFICTKVKILIACSILLYKINTKDNTFFLSIKKSLFLDKLLLPTDSLLLQLECIFLQSGLFFGGFNLQLDFFLHSYKLQA